MRWRAAGIHYCFVPDRLGSRLRRPLFRLSSSSADERLVFVQVIARHGARCPLHSFPGLPFDESYWGFPLGALLPHGLYQHYQIGVLLRKLVQQQGQHELARWPSLSSPTAMYVRATKADRCLNSAASLQRGLLGHAFSLQPEWDGIDCVRPVDPLLKGHELPTFERHKAELYASQEWHALVAEAKPLLTRLTLLAGTDVELKQVTHIDASIRFFQEHKVPADLWRTVGGVPAGLAAAPAAPDSGAPIEIDSALGAEVSTMAWRVRGLKFCVPERAREAAGRLVGDLRARLFHHAWRAASSTGPIQHGSSTATTATPGTGPVNALDAPVVAMVGHDGTLLALLANLGLDRAPHPLYGAFVRIELYRPAMATVPARPEELRVRVRMAASEAQYEVPQTLVDCALGEFDLAHLRGRFIA